MATRNELFFLFDLSSHHYIGIVKYLFTSKDDYFENLGEIIVLACEIHFLYPSIAQKCHVLKLSIF